MKLMVSEYVVTMDSDSVTDFTVHFHGPKETPFEGGVWRVHVELPPDYPYRSPSIGFLNKIFHPNIDFGSGSVCLDVINQTWSPMFDLLNIFESFLPQLLRYPNPTDPLNGEAAAMQLREPAKYNEKVVELVKLYAAPENVDNDVHARPGAGEPSDDEPSDLEPEVEHEEIFPDDMDDF